VFNLWSGVIQPVEGDWSLAEELICGVMATRDVAVGRYLLDWLALAAQRPWEKPGTVIVLKGLQGTGKSLFGRLFTSMFGRHGQRLDAPGQLTGRFNEHLRQAVALFVDEAFWSGDKAGEAALKGLVTEDSKQYEAKFKGLTQGRSYLHIAMATNNERAASIAGKDERRYVIVEPGHQRPPSFYAAIAEGLASGSLQAALLHALLKRDLAGFSPQAGRPLTEAYQEQAALSMDPVEAWLRDFVDSGYELKISDFGAAAGEPGEANAFRKTDVFEAVRRFHRDIGSKAYEHGYSGSISKALRRLLPQIREKRIGSRGSQQRCFAFPEIGVARRQLGMPE
jgi:hypothetical protein